MKNHSNKHFLGIDIGGTAAKCAIISDEGEIVSRSAFDTGIAVSKEKFISSIYHVVDDAIAKKVGGIGICSLGIVNSKTGQIIGAVENMPYLYNMNIRDLILSRYPEIPVFVSNDVKSVARGEQWMGAAKGCRNFFCVALGTGVGAVIVIDSKVIEGVHYRAGEVCYMNYKSPHDYLEKYISTKHVMDIAAVELGVAEIDGFKFFQLVREGVPIAMKILNEWICKIARFVANLIVILDVEKVIIGGGISSEKNILIPRIAEAVEQMLPAAFRGETIIEGAKCANDAGVLGAVSMLAMGSNILGDVN